MILVAVGSRTIPPTNGNTLVQSLISEKINPPFNEKVEKLEETKFSYAVERVYF